MEYTWLGDTGLKISRLASGGGDQRVRGGCGPAALGYDLDLSWTASIRTPPLAIRRRAGATPRTGARI